MKYFVRQLYVIKSQVSVRKDSIISVRVADDTKTKLMVESQMKSLTLNTLVGQIITKHTSWDRFAEDMGFIFLNKPFLRAIISLVPEKEMTTIAVTVCRGAMKDAAVYMYGEMTYETFIKSLDLWLGASHIPFRHITTDVIDRYVIQHGIGLSFSHYLITVINSILNELKFKASCQEIKDQSIGFVIEKA